MIAAASFGLRRSGTFATATSGAAYWAASVRHGPPWPLPVNAPKSIFQNSNPIQGRELSGLLSLLKTGVTLQDGVTRAAFEAHKNRENAPFSGVHGEFVNPRINASALAVL